ncbi:YbfB/YjiJ family MFS transporter [Azohydromonas caseinilytica]|uniref:YbfB/YjiJ family MFS transporter n=1 Tax=Azohydromonas caseinilytica TaxID=2728836 RepID=A0A848F3H1_9BURK|nr:YbfB/YjiJ family MFS transporter [Azohydromonas caseinilytica]NML13608.1 YbfB/YjiJ family MFS transporter [Azohydromonas caseinilytica]
MSRPLPSPPAAASATPFTSLVAAAGLALAAAVSLGLSRFSYALLLPPMAADLGWNWFTGGAMNTANAAGYLLGALLAPRALARHDARALLLGGGFAAALLLALHGAVRHDALLAALRLLTGVASAASFISGGLLAARLAAQAGHAGLLLGLYYGGTGLGIVASALLVPLAVRQAPDWPWAWLALGGAALGATLLTARATRALHADPAAAPGTPRERLRWAPLAFALAGYLMFGLGYIGYMSFVIALLREQGLSETLRTGFYVLLGVGVVASSWLWAALLQRARAGGALALLNGLLALATLLPVLSAHPLPVFVSGALFGAVFLSVVASTTALVRRNLPPAQWPAGIAAFTIVFAAGQIAGPTLVGWLADGPGGLTSGFLCSAAALALGSVLALGQRPLAHKG